MTRSGTHLGAGSVARGKRIIVAGTDTNVGKTVFAATLVGALDGYYWKPVQAGYDANARRSASLSPVGGEDRDEKHLRPLDQEEQEPEHDHRSSTTSRLSPGTGEGGRRPDEGPAAGTAFASSPSSASLRHLLPREKEESWAASLADPDRETVLRLSGLPAGRMLPEAYRLQLPAAPAIAAAAEGITLERARLECVPAIADNRPLVIETAGGLLVPMAPGLLQIDLFRAWLAAPEHATAHDPPWFGAVVVVAPTRLGTINHTLLSLEALRARRLPIAGVAFVGEADPAAEAEIAAHGGVRRLGRLPRLDRLEAADLAAAFANSIDIAELAP